MKPRVSSVFFLTVTIAVAGSLIGCDSGNDGDELSAETSEAVAQTFSDAFTVISLAIAEVQVTKTQPNPKTANPQGTCPKGGTFDVNGSSEVTQDSFSLDVAVGFEDCNGLNGALSIDGSGLFTASNFYLDLMVDGSITGEQCSLSFDQFRETVSSDLTNGNTSLTLDGTYRGACANDRFTCSFNEVNIDASSTGSAQIVAQSCRLD